MAKRSTQTRQSIPKTPVHEEGVLTSEFVLPSWGLMLIHAAIIVAAGLWVYWPAMNGDWLWDDDVYIYKNPLMNDPARLWKAWFQPGSFMEYYPIEQTVQWIQWQLWHNDTFGYHLTNVILHITSGLLLWRLLGKLGLPLAWLGGLIFVCHPANIESVAWIVELKNTLSLPFFLLSMCAWIDYEEKKQSRDYLLALGLFLVAMLCKITMAPFPAVILLYAWWKRGRIDRGDLIACAPFLVISIVLMEATAGAGSSFNPTVSLGGSDVLPVGGALSQFLLAGLSLAFYFSSTFLPANLLPIYPVWSVDPPSPLQFLPWLVLAIMLGVLFWKRETWGRHGLLGLGFFLLTIAPFAAIGLAFHPRDSWVMNHFLYIPMIGLISLVVAAIGDIDDRLTRKSRTYSTGIVTLLIVLLAFQARGYASAFTNEETYWTYTLERNPAAWTAHNNLGKILLMNNQLQAARDHFEAALRYDPTSPESNANLGATLVQMGLVSEGVAQFWKALAINPNDAVTHNDLGVVLGETGHGPEALQQFAAAIKVQPNYPEAYNNMGNAYVTNGQLAEATKCYLQATAIKPDYAEAHNNLGVVLSKQGHLPEALEEYAKAVSINPEYVAARSNMADVLRGTGHNPEAIAQYEIILQLDPDNQRARSNLAQLQSPSANAAPK